MHFFKLIFTSRSWGSSVGGARGVMVKVLYCGIVGSKFELQSCFYVHFRTNILGKGMKPLILQAHTWQPQEHRKRSLGNTLWSTWSMDLYNHWPIHNNPCAWFVRKTFLMKQWSRLVSSNIYRRFIPINLVKQWRSFILFEINFCSEKQ